MSDFEGVSPAEMRLIERHEEHARQAVLAFGANDELETEAREETLTELAVFLSESGFRLTNRQTYVVWRAMNWLKEKS